MAIADGGDFKCPKCGGWKFGTNHCTSNYEEWIGECHGDKNNVGCGFTWHRMTDDEKYFTRRKPSNKD